MTAELETDWAAKIGQPAYSSIAERVAALECDYDRLGELKEARADYDPTEGIEDLPTGAVVSTWEQTNPDDAEELKDLEEAAGECESLDDAQTRVQDDALDVTIRGELRNGEWEADEFTILLSTGGPAVRIKGEIDGNGEPDRAWLEVQDWFKPWTQYFETDQETLLTYARRFMFAAD